MCGITGYSFLPEIHSNISNLSLSLESLRHRGPDDSGIYQDVKKGVGLAHTRLSILDLSPLGHQPMFSDDGKFILIFNGEIYNYKTLRFDLETKGHVFKGHSDTEVLLHLLQEAIENKVDVSLVLKKLNGIFAFGLLDVTNNVLFVARDAFGVKPLYYAIQENKFAFASEIKALLPFFTDMNELDKCSIDRYLSFLWCPGNGTPLKHVKKLCPGESLWIKEGLIIDQRKWFFLPDLINGYRKTTVTNHLRVDDFINQTEHHLRQAVHRQMVADVQVGAFLSGGLDSSSIVSFARELNPNIKCFTIQASNWELDEVTDDVPYAIEVAKHLNVPLDIVPVDSQKMAMDFADMVVKLDEPLADPACLNVLYISRLARECGIKVLLSGAGGDDIFTGYRRHRALELEKYWSWLPVSLRYQLHSLTELLNNNSILLRRVKKMFRSAHLDPESRLIDYFTWIGREDLERLYTPDFKAAIGDSQASTPIRDFLNDLSNDLPPLEKMLAIEQRFFLTDHNLIYTDKMSMAAGVEVRVPFLDMDLVEYVSSIPLKYKQKRESGKWILKKTMEPYLPQNIIYRRKSGFGAPLRQWVKYELSEMIGDILSENSLMKRGFFEPTQVRRLIDDNSKGKIDASYSILSLLLVELWCRKFLDGSIGSNDIVKSLT
jgi:asparagine synthase (glutamine-hydrolysing)